MEYIISAVFDDEKDTYVAFSNIKNSPFTEDYTISQMAIVKRENGYMQILDSFDTGVDTENDTVIGGIIGGVIGIIGGPIGILIGGSLGAILGNLMDREDADEEFCGIELVASHIAEGDTALIIIASEEDVNALDNELNLFSCRILREDAAAVSHQIDMLNEETARMQKELKDKLKAEHKSHKVEHKRNKLKEEFDKIKDKFKHN